MNNKDEFVIGIDFDDISGILDRSLPDPALVEYYRMLGRREIMWNQDVDVNAIDVSMYIRKWNMEDKDVPVEERKPIKIFINTDGGDLNTIMNVIDVVKLSKTPVITIGMGKTYSAGGLLLMAGHKRYIFNNTSCLIHDGSTGAYGSIGKFLDNLEFTKKLEERVQAYILENTTIPKKTLIANWRKDWFLFSDEIIKYGIADEIISDIETLI